MKILIPIIIAIGLTGCATTNTTNLKYPMPTETAKPGQGQSVIVVNPATNKVSTVMMTPKQLERWQAEVRQHDAQVNRINQAKVAQAQARQQQAHNNPGIVRQGLSPGITENAVEDVGQIHGGSPAYQQPQPPPMNALQKAYYDQTHIYVAPVGGL